MTERKPAGVSFESWIDRQIRTAEERGDFADNPGNGKPLPGLDEPYDENRWIRDKVRREGLDTDALLPPPLRLRKEVERLPAEVRDLPTEAAVRAVVAALNGRILAWLRDPSGPAVPLRPVDPEPVVAGWHAHRRTLPSPAPAAEPAPAPRKRWWHR
jgi:hypothetical protein